jgi:hypothetical protein
MRFYTLIGQTVTPCSREEWAEMFNDPARRRVLLTRIGPFEVSTVFLGLDHNFSQQGPPLLFETMTFLTGTRKDYDGNDCDGRWSTWAEAEEAHRRAVRFIQQEFCGSHEEPVEVDLEE